MRGRAAQLCLEDGQRTAHIVSAHLHCAARFGKADQRHQNMLQTKRQQQTFAGSEDHRAKIARTVDDATNPVNPQRKDWPDQRNNKAKQTHDHKGYNGYKAGAPEERQRIRQADIVEALMQHPDNHPGDHRAEDPGINGLNPDNALNVVRFKHGGIGGGQNAFSRQPEVHRKVHYRITDKPGKGGHAFVLACQPQRDSNTEHHRQEAEGEGADFTHPDKDRLQHRCPEERDQRDDVLTAQ